jgi:hypothetical protein
MLGSYMASKHHSTREKIEQATVTNPWSRGGLMSTHASVLVDSVRPPSAEVCRTAASFP